MRRLTVMAMPVMMTFFMLLLPTGLCLYMVTSSAVGITQQRYMYWKMDQGPPLLATGGDDDGNDDQAADDSEAAAPKRAKPRGKKRTRRGRA